MEAIICDYENGKETETRYIIDLWGNYTIILLKKHSSKMAPNDIWPHPFLTLFFMVFPLTVNVTILITVSPFLLTHIKLLILQKLILYMSILDISKSHYS